MTLAYALPGAAVWAVLGATLGVLTGDVWVILALTVYALVYGLSEVSRFGLPAPSTRWQVPSTWVRGRSRTGRIAIWGAVVGPGIMTPNPYASIWVIPALMTFATGWAAGAAMGALVGLTHGATRALGTIHAARAEGPAETLALKAILRQMRWGLVDGILLLVIVAAVATVALT